MWNTVTIFWYLYNGSGDRSWKQILRTEVLLEILSIPQYLGWYLKYASLGNLYISLWDGREYEVQFSSVAQACPTPCNPMNCSMPGLPVHHKLPDFTHTHAHRVGDAIQPSHPLSSPSPPAFDLSQHQGLLQWVNSSHEVAKVLEFQPQHQSFQWTPRTDLL